MILGGIISINNILKDSLNSVEVDLSKRYTGYERIISNKKYCRNLSTKKHKNYTKYIVAAFAA